MKTPEEMAMEYIKDVETARNPSVTATAFPQMQRCFLAGYQAAQHKDKAVNRTHLAWKLAEDYGAVKWLKHKDPKRFGSTERDYEYTIARDGFYQGYQAAKDPLADADKVMCSTTMEEIKAVDTGELMPITNLPTPAKWISVKERLPEVNELCIVNTEWRGVVPATYGNESWIFDDGQGWSEKALSYASHWMPLPSVEGLKHED